jgi:hypothetical protein
LHIDEEDGEAEAEAGGEAGEDDEGGVAGATFEGAEVRLLEAGFLAELGLRQIAVGAEVAETFAEEAKDTVTVERHGNGSRVSIYDQLCASRPRERVAGK